MAAGLLFLLSVTAFSSYRILTVCYLHLPSSNTQSQTQGIKLVQMRATVDGKTTNLRPTSSPQCTTYKTTRQVATVVPDCYWQLSTNVSKNSGQRGRCSVSNLHPLKIFDPDAERGLSEAEKKNVCIIASVQKGSRSCNRSNSQFCVLISTQANSISYQPILFEIQKIHGKTADQCRSIATNNIS